LKALVAALLAFALVAGAAQGALPTLAAPQIFAPGIISGPANDGSPTFSRDGHLLLFTRSGSNWGIILESQRSGARWSEPRIAAFSGEWPDSSPEFSPDGKYVVYVSIRPTPPAAHGVQPLKASHRANLWRVNRVGTGWSTPVRLPNTVNFGPSIWKPSMAADGSIYFVSIDKKGGKRLFCARFKAGAFQMAQPLTFSDGSTGDVDPEVAPDESFMVFSSDGRVPGDAKDHLFIVLRSAGKWGTPAPLRYSGDRANGSSTDDEPHLSPDLHTLYFSSDRSMPVHFPRSRAQAQQDLERVEVWDNSNSNAWSVPLSPALLEGAKMSSARAGPRSAAGRCAGRIVERAPGKSAHLRRLKA